MDRATVFGEVAETYDRMRPSYPDAMYDDLIAETGVKVGSPVLEIGCGTGIATTELGRRGLHIDAIDPDPRMLRLTRERVTGLDVRCIERSFENYDSDAESFSLVFAAGSWHWVDAQTGLPKAATLLNETGSLAVCWNLPRPETLPRPSGFDAAYRKFAPKLADVASQVKNRTQEHRRQAIVASNLFKEPVSFSYPWTRTLSSADYTDLLSTHSDHRMLGMQTLAALLKAVRDELDQNGGAIELAYETVLYVAHKLT
jgi:ubiquinone/menaquinone biosynthesis C-methylase UbiE